MPKLLRGVGWMLERTAHLGVEYTWGMLLGLEQDCKCTCMNVCMRACRQAGRPAGWQTNERVVCSAVSA